MRKVVKKLERILLKNIYVVNNLTFLKKVIELIYQVKKRTRLLLDIS